MAEIESTALTGFDLFLYETITQAIEQQLEQVREINPPLEVHVRDGVVTLSGVVIGTSVKRQVLMLAAGTPGVIKVIDRLYTDPDLELQVAAALAEAPNLQGLRPLLVSSLSGQVTISGKVHTPQQHAEAAQTALRVRGVVEVINNLVIEP